MPRIFIQVDRCRRCGMCVEICPEGLFVQTESNRIPKISNPKACISCGHCVSICPSGAVTHQNFSPGDLGPRNCN